MKKDLIQLVVFTLCVTLFSCGKSGDEHHKNKTEKNPEQGLYDDVMKLHDEGMAKMDEIYQLKEELKEQIASAPELVEEKKKEIEAKIAKLDSAQRGMMVWMRSFNPDVESLGEQGYHNYLESEMEKVKKVKDDIFDAIARARQE